MIDANTQREPTTPSGARCFVHALTIDVEDYHNVIARDWLGRDGPPTDAVVRNTDRLLQHFADHGVRATMFVLGEVAETFPDLVRRMAGAGHEIGVHGYYHRQVFKLTPESFRAEVEPARKRLQDLTGQPVAGHRAPAFSIMPSTQWALEVLADAGFEYDSSIFPIRGRRYGWPGFRHDIHRMTLPSGRTIIEAPLSTVAVLGRAMPVCGGGYLRHFPAAVTHWAMRRVGRLRPAILYTHPYEIELPLPPLDTRHLAPDAARRTRRFHWLQRRNRHTVERKIIGLLKRFPFAPLGEVIQRAIVRHASGALVAPGAACDNSAMNPSAAAPTRTVAQSLAEQVP
ncbi:Peptidoglycan deacetylase [Phycisphaerae bacterium RAS2]|nr:Peptidoglycan deacetylase [Phycisphaerae bacterium RAS2]